jgi:thymidylate synthase (FAD)
MKAEYISHMGDDLTVVNAARVSFDKVSKFVNEEFVIGEITTTVSQKDKGLINYLAKHGHWTPFSHPQITMRYTVPIFVARQEFKHIVGFTRNEVSRRYVDDTPEFYVPRVWRSRPEGSVKQGSGSSEIDSWETHPNTWGVKNNYDALMHEIMALYDHMLEEGVAPEMARMVLPQSMYTSYYITGSLAAFARFVKQRTDPHAQVEIQDLAKMVDKVIKPLYPISWEALLGDTE